MHVLFLELGVGANTPGVIKCPFWQMTAENEKAVYARINLGRACCPQQIAQRAICLDADIEKIWAPFNRWWKGRKGRDLAKVQDPDCTLCLKTAK